MKILLLSDWMSNRGGAESYIVSLRDGLREQGDEVQLIACGAAGQEVSAGDTMAFGSDSAAAQVFLQLVNPFAVSSVRSAIRDFQPDAAIVSQFAYHLSPAILKALRPVPTVVTIMDYKAICPTGTRLLPNGTLCDVRYGRVCNSKGCVGFAHWLRDRPRYSMIASALRNVDRVMCPSSWMQKELALAGVEATTVPLGVKAGTITAGKPAKDPLFAYVGRFSREKGVAVLLAAFSRLVPDFPRARLRLIGDGPLRGQLVALVEALGITGAVEFAGWSTTARLGEQLNDVWSVVCPSLWAEPFGIAAIEAVQLGIPAIASDTGGFRETIEDGVNGILFRAGDVASLEASLRSIASGARFKSRRLAVSVVEQSRARHAMSVHAQRVKGVLNEVVGASAH